MWGRIQIQSPFMAWVNDSEGLTMGDVVDEWNRLNR
jgi:hypothetical protein